MLLLLLKICMLMMRRHTFFSLCFPLVIMIPQLDLQLAMVKVRLFPFKKFASEWSVTWLEGHVLCCCCSLCVTMIFRHVRLVAFHAGNFLSELPIPFFISAIIHPTELYPHRHSDYFFVWSFFRLFAVMSPKSRPIFRIASRLSYLCCSSISAGD